jgi:hypothetical protein
MRNNMKPTLENRPKIKCRKCGRTFRTSEWTVAEDNHELVAVPTTSSIRCDHSLYIANLEQICR